MVLYPQVPRRVSAVGECDICHKPLYVPRRCSGCKKDLCSNCLIFWDNDPWSGDYLGDYPMTVCISCDRLAAPYKRQASAIRHERDYEFEQLDAAWRQKCAAREER